MAPFNDSPSTQTWNFAYHPNTIVVNPTVYESLQSWQQWDWTQPPQLAPVYTLTPGRIWSNLRERDRWHLDRARTVLAPPLATPTRRVRTCLVFASPSRRLRHGSRWERNPLNKRALARR